MIVVLVTRFRKDEMDMWGNHFEAIQVLVNDYTEKKLIAHREYDHFPIKMSELIEFARSHKADSIAVNTEIHPISEMGKYRECETIDHMIMVNMNTHRDESKKDEEKTVVEWFG